MEIETVEVDSEVTPLGRVSLHRYAAESGEIGYEIRLDGSFLMASHGSHSERAMAAEAHRRLDDPNRPLTALVGGLGAGHTLRAALDLPGVERAVVVEIGAKVVDWARTLFTDANQGALDDPRVEVVVGDVCDHVADHPAAYDLVLLDVDNGPDWLAAAGNLRLYSDEILAAARRSLRPDGVLALWSPQRSRPVEDALRRVFGELERADTLAEARRAGEPPSTVYLARKRRTPGAGTAGARR